MRVLSICWECNLSQWVMVEIFFGEFEWNVRFVVAEGEEEWLVNRQVVEHCDRMVCALNVR